MSHRHIQSMRYPQQGIDGNVLLSAFNLPNIVGMEVSQLCQSLLRKVRFLPGGTQGLP